MWLSDVFKLMRNSVACSVFKHHDRSTRKCASAETALSISAEWITPVAQNGREYPPIMKHNPVTRICRRQFRSISSFFDNPVLGNYLSKLSKHFQAEIAFQPICSRHLRPLFPACSCKPTVRHWFIGNYYWPPICTTNRHTKLSAPSVQSQATSKSGLLTYHRISVQKSSNPRLSPSASHSFTAFSTRQEKGTPHFGYYNHLARIFPANRFRVH